MTSACPVCKQPVQDGGLNHACPKYRQPSPCKLITKNGYEAIVDAEDFIFLNKYSWWGRVRPNGRIDIYRSTRIKGKHKTIHLSREIMNPPHGMVVDHINHDRSDNRKANLRICSLAENNRNSTARKGKKYKGLIKRNRDGIVRWSVQIKCGGVKNYVGSFSDEVTAAKAYDAAAIRLHGEFACLNFPKDSALENT